MPDIDLFCQTNVRQRKELKMDEEERTRRDIRFGKDGIERLERLARESNKSSADIAREAVFAYEVAQSGFRDTVRDAVLNLYHVMQPDGQYDPVDDPRSEDAVRKLGTLLGSMYAAEGIQLAIAQTVAQGLSS
jgi:hypothetical protein